MERGAGGGAVFGEALAGGSILTDGHCGRSDGWLCWSRVLRLRSLYKGRDRASRLTGAPRPRDGDATSEKGWHCFTEGCVRAQVKGVCVCVGGGGSVSLASWIQVLSLKLDLVR